MHMRKTPSPPIIRPPQISVQEINFQQHHAVRNNNNHHSVLDYIKSAAKKVAGVFSLAGCKGAKADATEIRGQAGEKTYVSIDNSSGSNSRFKHSDSSGSHKGPGGQVGTVVFSVEEIYEATANFSPENKIGEGGFGTVYKAKLKDGSLVAVKRSKKDMYNKRLSTVIKNEVHSTVFKNEVLTLSQIEHMNLVRFFGYLEHGDEQIILVEYVGNGTLREHLDGIRGNGLEIAERLDIAIDVAHAITYLHMYTDPPIIHRDIKSSNILITEKLRAKVADFGFARLASEDPGATHISTQVKGTAGYLDPEYLKTNQLTEKSDVYSFGVLLVELITGRQPIEPKKTLKERVTIKWAMQRLKEGEAVMAMDPRLRRSPASVPAVEKVLKLARQCLASSRPSRPSMKKCAEVLWRIRKDFSEKGLSVAASTSILSANVFEGDARKNRHDFFGIEDGDSYRFRSA